MFRAPLKSLPCQATKEPFPNSLRGGEANTK